MRNMKYNIKFSAIAEQNLQQITAYIAKDSLKHAQEWLKNAKNRIHTLGTFPAAHAYAPEHFYIDFDVRQTVLGTYRILFTIKENTVFILTIRQGAQRGLHLDELKDIAKQ